MSNGAWDEASGPRDGPPGGRLRRCPRARCATTLRVAIRSLPMLAVVVLPCALHAQSAAVDGTVALSSELVDRGQAMSRDTPVLQGAVSWTSPAGWSLGLAGSTATRSPGRLVEALAQLSRHWSLSSDWQMQTGLLYYRYPGSTRATAYDRTEAALDWSYRDVLTLGLSAIHASGASSHPLRGAADINLHWPLTRQLSLAAGAGMAQSLVAPRRAYHYGHASYGYGDEASVYGYGHAGLSWSDGPWRVELDLLLAGAQTRRQWATQGASPWVATISRSF